MQLGELAKKYSVNRETIRFYERKKLLPRPARSSSGYRLYDAQAEKILGFVVNAKRLGFSLEEIKSLLDLRVINNENCGKIRNRALEKIAEIDAKIDYMKKLRKALEKLVASCIKKQSTSYCPILEHLEN